MTKNKNKVIFLIVGLTIGVFSTIGIYTFKEFMDSWKTISFIYSTSNLKKKTSSIGIELPEKAYNIEFYLFDGFLDYNSYLAFSASEKEIRNFIGQAPMTYDKKMGPKPTPDVIKDKQGQSLIDWWPEDTKDFEIYYGQFRWMGYDTKNSRLYLYQYSM